MTSTETKSLNSDFWEKYSHAGYQSLLERYPIEKRKNDIFGYSFSFAHLRIVKEVKAKAAAAKDTADQYHTDRGVEDPIAVGAASVADSKAQDRINEEKAMRAMNLPMYDEMFDSVDEHIQSLSESIGAGTFLDLGYSPRDDGSILGVIVLVYRKTSRKTPNYLPTEALLEAWVHALANDVDDPECEPRFGWFTR
ncbi:hypothetical protein QCA50_011250 [Cerrena zonata]|uniref:Uncharacterized protein n=1 Tax=Cerrena zonata TaxID=2478898 RepID=A0AAW0FZ40_9APHY